MAYLRAKTLMLPALLLLGACGGHVSGSIPNTINITAHTDALPKLPHFTAAYLASLSHARMQSVAPSGLPPAALLVQRALNAAVKRESAKPAGPRRGSSAGSGDSEAVGVIVNSGGPYTGIVGFQTAYTPFTVPQTGTAPQIQVGFPPGGAGSSSMLAPLLLPSNGSCLAPTVLYTDSGASTTALFAALDFCGGTYDFVGTINDSSAVQQYIGTVNGLPGFYTVTLTSDKVPTSTSTWYLLVYNFALARFDVLASKVGLSSNKTGLALFIGQFAQGQCPLTPSTAATGMQLYNATSGAFEALAPTMPAGTTSVVVPVGSSDSCFNADMTGPASFTFSVLNANSSWQVTPVPPTVSISEFSSGISNGSGPSGIAAGPDGNLWFTEVVGRIARINTSGTTTEFSSGISAGASPSGITAGPDGNLWFTEANGNRIGRITPTAMVTEFSSGISANSYPNGIAAGPDGNLWFTEQNGSRIGRITPSGTVTEFSSGITANSAPVGITAGPDGNLWFTELNTDRVGRITTAGTVTEFSSGISAGAAPNAIALGPDGNLWFTEYGGNRIGRITISGTVTEFSSGISAGATLWGIAAGADGNMWFTEFTGNRIGRITPNGTVTEFSSGISSNAGPISIVTGGDGNLWSAEHNANRVARVIP